jgi:hypothetical protein
MTTIMFALAVVALVVYGLERNHRAHAAPGPRLAGSNDVEDRDLPRVRGELHPADARPVVRRPRRARVGQVRPTAC